MERGGITSLEGVFYIILLKNLIKGVHMPEVKPKKEDKIKGRNLAQRLSIACFELRPQMKPTAKNPHFNSKFIELDAVQEIISNTLRPYGIDVFGRCKFIPELDKNILVLEMFDLMKEEFKPFRESEFGLYTLTPEGKANYIHKVGGQVTYLSRYHLMIFLNSSTDKDKDGGGEDQSRGFR